MGVLVSFVLRIHLTWITWGLVKLNCRYLLNGELKKKTNKLSIFITFASLCMINHRKRETTSVTRYQFL